MFCNLLSSLKLNNYANYILNYFYAFLFICDIIIYSILLLGLRLSNYYLVIKLFIKKLM